MKPGLKLEVSIAACGALAAGAVGAILAITWSALAPAQRTLVQSALIDNLGALLFVSALLLVIVGMFVRAVVQAYVVRPLQLAEETRLILNANPRHRIHCSGPRELSELAASINALAARCESLQSDVDARVAEANRDLERERNRLATLMAELTESVIVCNAAGSILLYNERARQLLEGGPNGGHSATASEWLGLGRSLFAGIDREVVRHGLEHLQHRLREGDRFPIAEFVTATDRGRLIRARMAAVTGMEAAGSLEVAGFVLILRDVQREVDLGTARERLLRSLTEGTRASLASIRAAAETLMQYPQMEASQHQKFLAVIHDETEKLGGRLEASSTHDANRPGGEWPLATMLGRDLMRALQRSVENRCGCPVALEFGDEPVWLHVDSFLLVEAVSHLARRLHAEEHARDITLYLARNGARVSLDLRWRSNALGVEQALAREKEPIVIPGHARPLSFKEIVERHGGETWYQRDAACGANAFCILLPVAEAEAGGIAPAGAGSRPVFYDFDLFHQAGQTPEIEECPLGALRYTVFDTETTGLRPSQGDEIIAIGAVRIVNGRLLTGEVFDQLVNPRRAIDKASTRVHGITGAMLHDRPTIEAVLPRFHRYCKDTVLVAHNAAFDMRFLQLKEAAAGVKFSHPVLDTLMLSAVAHPNHSDHSLEAIAARLGVDVIGRHTALGDAMVAGEIFLKLIPLLRERGIVTFRDAHQAARKTPFARMKY